ncbi:MAG: hypothetical protein H8Z69_03135 [Nanohaloarchaea archaeon]|nr:hypothetical protein [Candidatus Nanohaloarchaea archaeon]
MENDPNVMKNSLIVLAFYLLFLASFSGAQLQKYEGELTTWKSECKNSGGEVVNSSCSCPAEAEKFSDQCWEKTPREACNEKDGNFMRASGRDTWVCEDPDAEIYGEIEISPEKYGGTVREVSLNDSESIATGNQTAEENDEGNPKGLLSGIIGFISSLF